MDNYKDNNPESKDPEWLERLLNGTDAPWEQDYPSEKKEDLRSVEETRKVPSMVEHFSSQDAELERILMENWSDTEPAAEAVPQEKDILDDDFEFEFINLDDE